MVRGEKGGAAEARAEIATHQAIKVTNWSDIAADRSTRLWRFVLSVMPELYHRPSTTSALKILFFKKS